MKITLSVIKADIGSIGGHIKPSEKLLKTVKDYIAGEGHGLVKDFYVGYTGDDIAILFTHTRGKGDSKIHGLAWKAFLAGTQVAKDQGLYGAGQDLLKSSFSGNVKGMGPAVCEMEFQERPNEPFLFFAADKTEPGAYNLPLYLAFADPMNTPGLLLSPEMNKGFKFRIMDVSYTKGDRVIELSTPEGLYDIAALLRDNERFVVESIYSKKGEIAAVVSTTRLHNIAGKYTGKDDPVMLVRVQKHFPATGEVLAAFSRTHYVGGGMRGSHSMPLMPMKLNSPTSYFDGPPMVSCAAFCVHNGLLTEPVDVFAHPYWDYVRSKASRKATEMREQGFSGAAMLPYSELEYGGIVEILKRLDKKFKVKK
ncbi:MAG: fructose 1,6-bisphosphatase [Candidatus Aenigmatarchaeota archaeon]|nr:MAG: fructose 1,6-bisphosphatase [Candidatus Aenigmarchaeota archaeon]RLJ07378.1 MAG: fructose 1,6-bisphosphatase [Candidatus Aenigmarchaeota archaeon]RLJ08165.1 MAG: fructose 1,6-bisphosphatase [Candidatus Aenigmarchaeota archaeon]